MFFVGVLFILAEDQQRTFFCARKHAFFDDEHENEDNDTCINQLMKMWRREKLVRDPT